MRLQTPTFITAASLGTFGNPSQRLFYGPGIANYDMAVHKVRRTTEYASLEFSFDSFDTFIIPSSTEHPRGTPSEMRYFRTILCRGGRFQGEAQNPRFDSAHMRSHGLPHLARNVRFVKSDLLNLEVHRRCADCQTRSSRVGAEEEKTTFTVSIPQCGSLPVGRNQTEFQAGR
jgi:hypothetical protein